MSRRPAALLFPKRDRRDSNWRPNETNVRRLAHRRKGLVRPEILLLDMGHDYRSATRPCLVVPQTACLLASERMDAWTYQLDAEPAQRPQRSVVRSLQIRHLTIRCCQLGSLVRCLQARIDDVRGACQGFDDSHRGKIYEYVALLSFHDSAHVRRCSSPSSANATKRKDRADWYRT